MVRKLFTIVGSLILVSAGCVADDGPTRPAAGRSHGASSAQLASDRVGADASPRWIANGASDDVVASTDDGITPLPRATVASAANGVGEQKPRSAAQQFDAAMLRMIGGEPQESFSSLPPDQGALISSVIDALNGFRHSLEKPGAMIETQSAPLVALSDQIRAQAPLSIPTLVLCRSVSQFGNYDPIEPARFAAGKQTPVIVYVELGDFHSRVTSDNRWETRLSYEAVLYTDGDTSVSVIDKKPTNIIDLCRNRRHDFFLADRLEIPAKLPVGKYILKVTVVDQLANHVAEKTVPLMISPGT